MKIAYVAGPYRGKDEFAVWQNILNAKRVAIKLWKKGYAVICPHANTAHFEHFSATMKDCQVVDNIADTTWLKGDLEILSRCDLVVMAPGWAKSEGARMEAARAKELGIIVFYFEPVVPEAKDL